MTSPSTAVSPWVARAMRDDLPVTRHDPHADRERLPRLCNARHPHLRYENGERVRCDNLLPDGGDHFSSYAMRAWRTDDEAQ